jgi:hypothetical protein
MKSAATKPRPAKGIHARPKTIDEARAEAFVSAPGRATSSRRSPSTSTSRTSRRTLDAKVAGGRPRRGAADLIEAWCKKRKLPGLKVERVQLEGRTPLLFMELPGQRGPSSQGDDTVVLYGHLDEAARMVGWRKGLGPWEPVRGGRQALRQRRCRRRLGSPR